MKRNPWLADWVGSFDGLTSNLGSNPRYEMGFRVIENQENLRPEVYTVITLAVDRPIARLLSTPYFCVTFSIYLSTFDLTYFKALSYLGDTLLLTRFGPGTALMG